MLIETSISHPAVVKSFVKFLCKELDIQPKRITVAEWEELESTVLGLCIDESEDEFIILVKEQSRDLQDVLITIAHEMIHVKQHVKQDLGWFLDNRGHIPYRERWWEIEAFRKSVPLVVKFAAHMTNIQNNVKKAEFLCDA
jgi:hypothetical protein